MAPVIERIDIEDVLLGEGPHWDAETQSLYFVDILGQYIHKYVPATKKHTKAHVGEKNASLIIPVEGKNDRFVVAIGREIVLVTWNGESEQISNVEKLYEVDENLETGLNDGKCDASGRLWAGTLATSAEGKAGDGIGSLYSFQNKKITKHASKVKLSNGLAFDTDRKKFYFIDSTRNILHEYDFDIENGAIFGSYKPGSVLVATRYIDEQKYVGPRIIISIQYKRLFKILANRKTIFTFNGSVEKFEVIDGVTIDTDGNLWMAVFSLSKIIKIDPRNPETIQDTIQLTSKQATSLTFGGPNLDELYVTTGKLQVTKEKDSTPPEGGGIYKITGLNAKGFPGVRVVL